MNSPAPEGIRLNKYLASAGLGSRRGCDALVQEGEVVINGEVCLNPGYRVQPDDFIKACGKRIEPLEVQSIVMHKPRLDSTTSPTSGALISSPRACSSSAMTASFPKPSPTPATASKSCIKSPPRMLLRTRFLANSKKESLPKWARPAPFP